jgi:hypothetical protein
MYSLACCGIRTENVILKAYYYKISCAKNAESYTDYRRRGHITHAWHHVDRCMHVMI